jgi:glycosyltransferase involved in cell wall biosynthesis
MLAMRVHVLPRYTRLGASSRVRFYQYVPYLERLGLQVTISPFFRDRYQKRFQKDGHKSPLEALRGYIGRTAALLSATRFELLWIEKDALPWIPDAIESILVNRGIPYVLDYDDAVFHQYDLHRSTLVRQMLGKKHKTIMRSAALVIAGNQYIKDHALSIGAPSVEIIPTVVDMERYHADLRRITTHLSRDVVVGWIGQRHNAHYLSILGEAVKKLTAEGVSKFTAVGAGDGVKELPFEVLPWSEATEIELIANFDIGIMPLPDEPFERGKCGYKLIQYMACGKPVVASPVGVNSEIVEHGVNGFLAETPQQWEHALRLLCNDSRLRERMGAAGRRKVETTYSVQATLPRLVELLKAAAIRQVPL